MSPKTKEPPVNSFIQSRRDNESGFTLIELLVVVLIIGILATIAVAAFNIQQSKAKEAAMKSDVRNVATAMMNAYVRDGKYPTDGRVNSGPVPLQADFRKEIRFTDGERISYYVYADENDLTKTFYGPNKAEDGTKPGFCVFVTHPTVPDVQWRWLSSENQISKQGCPAKVLEATAAP